jgi:carbonic anhydrase
MPELFTLNSEEDMPLQLRQTPIGEFLRYHNFNAEFKMYTTAGLLIGMCMDNRKTLRVPDNFAYILRTGGAIYDTANLKLLMLWLLAEFGI